MRARGGQVTIFIILGLVLLLLVAALFLLDTSSTDGVENVLPERDGVEKYVSSCLDLVSRDALIKLGMQGGYINFPDNYYEPSTYIQELKDGVKVPLWLYRGQYIIPTTEYMEKEISQYVKENIDKCLMLESLSEVDTFSSESEPEVEVSINAEDISINMDYKIFIEQAGRKISYGDFYSIIDLNLRKIIESATFMTEKHYDDMFIDRATVNILSLDSDIPLGGIEFGCRPKVWSKRDVKNTLQNYLKELIPTIRISGTSYRPFNEQLTGEDPLLIYETIDSNWGIDEVDANGGLPDEIRDNLPGDMYEYLHMYWDVGEYDWGNLNLGLSYFPSYGMRMEVNPSSGDRIEAVPGDSEYEYLQFLCVNIYHYTYDIEYPLKVSLYDEDAFGGEGYLFNFGLPITIDHNYPTRDAVGWYTMDAIQTDPEFCNTTYDEPVTIAAKDYYSGMFINNVNFSYDCVRYYCDLGATNTADNYGAPALKANLPIGCTNPYFIAEHEDYIKEKTQILGSDFETGVEVQMVPLKTFTVKVADLAGVSWPEMYITSIYLKSLDFDYTVFTSPDVIGGQSVIKLIDSPGTEYSAEIVLATDDGMVGGWIGNFTVSSEDLEKDTVVFHAFEELPHPQTSDDEIELYLYLDQDDPLNPYREEYAPEFS